MQASYCQMLRALVGTTKKSSMHARFAVQCTAWPSLLMSACCVCCCVWCCMVWRQAAPFSRLAGSDATMLGITLSLAEKALQLQPDNVNMVSGCCQRAASPALQQSC
jgi:hypothetical protein